MSRASTATPLRPAPATRVLETVAAWLLGLLWVLPAMGIIKWLILEPRPKG